jgi:hypothetical protein
VENGIMEGIPTYTIIIFKQCHPRHQLTIKTFYYFKIEIQHSVSKKNLELVFLFKAAHFP